MRKFFFILLASLTCLCCSTRSKAPLIGISAGISERGTHTVPDTYVAAIRRAGGIPVILPALSDSALVEDLIARMDGLLFTGGADINPARYGEEIIPDAGVEINARRDTSDLLYARAALRSGKEVLGICRGAQLLNVAAGGSLYQDLPSQHPGPIAHRQEEPDGVPTHAVACEKGGFLFDLYGQDSLYVNSFHHQAVKALAPVYTVAAVASDGVVEAYQGPHVVAVQFHPEKQLAAGDDAWLPLFRAFVARCRR